MNGCNLKYNALNQRRNRNVNREAYTINRNQGMPFNMQNSFDQSLFQQKNDKFYRKPLLPWVASLSIVIFALSFVNSRAKESIESENVVNRSAGSYLEFDLNNSNSGIFANELGNIGVGTKDPNYKLEVSGALALEDSVMPDITGGHAGIYSSQGELYTFDASGNSTKISSHDENGLWQYSSRNEDTGKELEVEMELLTKELNKILGGGYVIENGETIDQGENTIKNLTLQTNENVSTLKDLQASIDSNLEVINGEINKQDKTTNKLLSSLANVKKDANDQADMLDDLQSKVKSLESENESLMDFFLAINPDTLVYLNEDGDLNLDGLISAREISTESVETEKIYVVSNDSSQSLGTAVITAGETEVVIENLSIEEGDKIFITPNVPMKQTIAATNIEAGEGFTVSMVEPLDSDVSFDWFVINEIDNKTKNIVIDEIQ